MKILIAGGTGFIGQTVTSHFLQQGNQIIILGRDTNKINKIFTDKVIAVNWETFKNTDKLSTQPEMVINLCGANIADKPWTTKRKKILLESRIKPTQLLANYCATNNISLFNASGVGIYGSCYGQDHNSLPVYTEEAPLPKATTETDFLSYLGQQWEMACEPARMANTRVINMRFGVVLGHGGILKKLLPVYKLGLGGRMGQGTQPLPWITLTDLISAISYLMDHPDINGPINFCAPEKTNQISFARTLADNLHRPCFLQVPEWLLKLSLGQMAKELLLSGQYATPQILLQHGFNFQYPTVDAAIKAIVQN